MNVTTRLTIHLAVVFIVLLFVCSATCKARGVGHVGHHGRGHHGGAPHSHGGHHDRGHAAPAAAGHGDRTSFKLNRSDGQRSAGSRDVEHRAVGHGKKKGHRDSTRAAEFSTRSYDGGVGSVCTRR